MSSQGKIKQLQTQIAHFKAQHPQRSWEQIHHLNCLYLELAHWLLVEKSRIKPIIQTWENLKAYHQTNGKWPLTKLKAFLLSQPLHYWEVLIELISQENNPLYHPLLKKITQWQKKS